MNSVKEIEEAIGNLSPEECKELRRWFDEHSQSQAIDERLKADLDAGLLDELIDRALADDKAGRTRPL